MTNPKNIYLLDCTLRDGGHINQGRFGASAIKTIIKNLVNAKIDIIEAGFLWGEKTDENTARYSSISELKKVLPADLGQSKIALMADNVDVSNLEPCDGTVEIIRLSFRKNELQWAECSAHTIIEKGYKCFINPIHGSSISDEEYLEMIDTVNKIHPYGFSIVDTFGAFRQRDLARLYYLIENNLDEEICLGIHLHENLGLAYSLAQNIFNFASPSRTIMIDGSLYGMGKNPGNLCIEQIMDFLNYEYKSGYSTEPVYDAIDEIIMPIYSRTRWGYSIPYALSGQCQVHRSYAEFLINKDRLRTKDIRRILKSIPISDSEVFNLPMIENLYEVYMNSYYDDSEYINKLSQYIEQYDKIIIIAPGKSIQGFSFESKFLSKSCVITVNFIYDKIKSDLCFFSSTKRLALATGIDSSNFIIVSDMIDYVENPGYILSRNELIYHDDIFCDDSTFMLLNFLRKHIDRKIYIIGFDGFKKDESNYFDNMLARKVRDDYYEYDRRLNILKNSYSSMDITFLTSSIYEKVFKK